MAFKLNRLKKIKGVGNTQVILFSVIALSVILFIVLYVKREPTYEGAQNITATWITPTNSRIGTEFELEAFSKSRQKEKSENPLQYLKYGVSGLTLLDTLTGSGDDFYIFRDITNNKYYTLFDYDHLNPDRLRLTSFNGIVPGSLSIVQTLPTGIMASIATHENNIAMKINNVNVYLNFKYRMTNGTQDKNAWYQFFIAGDSGSAISDIINQNKGRPGILGFFGLANLAVPSPPSSSPSRRRAPL
jgi:hypothetical protein